MNVAADSLPTSGKPGKIGEAWASSGRHVFPCAPWAKTPLTPNGFQDATTDAAQLQRWQEDYPGCNWACWPGPGGEVVLDYDPFHADDAGRAMLERYRDATAGTLSPTFGVHLWWKLPAGVTLGNGAGSLPRGWDVRAHNGYVLVPPAAVRYTGKAAASKGVADGYTGRYQVVRAGPVAELPADLLTLILQPRKLGKTKSETHKPGCSLPDFAPVQKSPVLTDGGVLAVCQGLPSGKKFARLWNGDTSDYAGKSTSEAVKGLVNYLTWVTQDVAQVDRLFRQSGLAPKYERWNRLAEYEILESLATRRAHWRVASGGA